MQKTMFLLLLPFLFFAAHAQDSKKQKRDIRKQKILKLEKQEEEGVITFRKQTVFGAKLTNDGFGGFFEIGRSLSPKNTLLFQLEITERNHAKEEKTMNLYTPAASYIYGKINYFYPIKLGVQKQMVIGNKSNKNGVSVTGNFGGGISLALLKPYFLEVFDTATNLKRWIRYESADAALFSNYNALATTYQAGGPSFSQGWSGLKVTPGLYTKAALRFDYGRFNEMVSGLEVGLTGEYYAKQIKQMVGSQYKQFFLNAYVSIIFGKRKS